MACKQWTRKIIIKNAGRQTEIDRQRKQRKAYERDRDEDKGRNRRRVSYRYGESILTGGERQTNKMSFSLK